MGSSTGRRPKSRSARSGRAFPICAWSSTRSSPAATSPSPTAQSAAPRPGGCTARPATKRSYQASFFDYVRIDDGRIIERVQQADVLAQMRQLYGKALGLVGLDAMFLRL